MFPNKVSRIFLLGAMLFGVSVLPQAAGAEDSAPEKNWSVDLNTSFLTDYMFRGVNLYDGASIQPSVGVNYDTGDYGSLSSSVWAHFSAEGEESAGEKFTEIDYTLSYAINFGKVGLSVGHLWYTYPRDSDGIDNSNELFASIEVDTFLTPTFSVFHDYDEFDAQYYELGISHTIETDWLGDGFNITPYVTTGFASHAEKVYADNGFVQVTFGTSFDAKLGDVTVTPSLNVTRESDDFADNEFWVGTNFAWSF